ncbi:hypothetical protein OEA41_009098 [Lepraria neglecta]|uniref:Uncharacterized protein n=1 Tax=Lepraria neglecta TaxID=209136 RepID=A0AAD9Z1B5_9LECA|nr:hypothetical protein OEA41_009098 [Lepraria neglecta]
MPRTLEPVPMDEATDWSGHILPRQMVKYLSIDCIVRVVIRNTDKGAEAIYFKITKIKDGTFWGIAQDTYRLWDSVGLPSGNQMTFRKEDINEIPLDWQPMRFQKSVAHLQGQIKNHGYALTGVRSATL